MPKNEQNYFMLLCGYNGYSGAEIAGVNRKTAGAYFNFFREKIFQAALAEAKKEAGIFGAFESYFGARRVRGKRGRGSCRKTAKICAQNEDKLAGTLAENRVLSALFPKKTRLAG